ncbi:MAG TPA: DUF2207 domain-containing protein [Cerasibacillus sp.]|uniref:DUF2207 domain-containing protein n=1 Tax=Cerasibacillus sp. TaxID=2498711 RepID=UPI002F3E2A56
MATKKSKNKILRYILIFGALIIVVPTFWFNFFNDDNDRSFSIDQVTIDAEIKENGAIHVRELYTYSFSGEFNGMTRSIYSDIENFKAYLLNDSTLKIDDEALFTQDLSDLALLEVEYDDDDQVYKVITNSKDEMKHVVYEYDIFESVKKYADVADLTYSFFDETNETDLHDVTITVRLPNSNMTEVASFLHADSGELVEIGNGVRYQNDLLKAGAGSEIRLIFPEHFVAAAERYKNKVVGQAFLQEEKELAKRRAELDDNMNQLRPYVVGAIVIVLAIGLILFIKHPNRHRGQDDLDDLFNLLEETDPLFIQYVDDGGFNNAKSIIAGLFSLKQRGIIKMEAVSSTRFSNETTYRFTIGDSQMKWTNLDAADQYLLSWLFTEKGEKGSYFMLDSILEHEEESDQVKEAKAEKLEKGMDGWSTLLNEREGYLDFHSPFRGYSIFSILLLAISYSIFFIIAQIDLVTSFDQTIIKIILSVVGLLAIMFSRNKWIQSISYITLIVLTSIFMTFTLTTWLAFLLYATAFFMILINANYIWHDHIKKFKRAIRIARIEYRKKRYPIGIDSTQIERRLENAIILGVGEEYGKQVGKDEQVKQLDASHLPLLSNPYIAGSTFDLVLIDLYSTVDASSSSSNTTSSVGGGGAGAF